MYKTEMHCHSAPVSRCAHAGAEVIVERYTAAGYSTVVLTNHISRWNFENYDFASWNDMMDFYLKDYHDLQKAAEGKLNILLGAEIQLDLNHNDYLIYGLNEEKLRGLGDVLPLGFRQFTDRVHEQGCLIYQAHPMRFGMTLMNPDWDGHYDGIEGHNAHDHHDSHNDLAQLWAAKLGLPMSSGSDFHDPEGHIGGGILTERPIMTMAELMNTLKSGAYELIRE